MQAPDFSQRLVVLDVEHTGLFEAGRLRLCEVAAVEIVGGEIGRVFHRYVNPGYASTPYALRAHGLTVEFLATQPVFTEVAPALLAFLGDAPLYAHNADSDRKSVQHDLVLTGHPLLANPWVCTQVLFRHALGKDTSMVTLAEHYGLPFRQHGDLHQGIDDALTLARAVLHLRDLPRDAWVGWHKPKTEKQAATKARIGVEIEGLEIVFRLEDGTVLRSPVPPHPEGYRLSIGHGHVRVLPPGDRPQPRNPLGPCVVGIKNGEVVRISLGL